MHVLLLNTQLRHLRLGILLCVVFGLALECSPSSEFCRCQESCSSTGLLPRGALPDCSDPLEGDAALEILRNATRSGKLANMEDSSVQAACGQLNCLLGCLQHCLLRLDALAGWCRDADFVRETCGMDCQALEPLTEPREPRELALCLVGQLRGVCKAEDFFSLFHVMLADFESVDAFLVFPDSSCLEDRAIFQAAADKWHSNLRIFTRCQPDSLDDPAESQLMEWFTGNRWWVHHWYNVSRWRNNILSLKHVHYCGQEVAKRFEETSYRFVARVRPDAEWFSFVTRLELESLVPGHILMNFVAMPIQGITEDSFAIGAARDMAAYFSLYADTLLDVDRLETTEVPWCNAHATLRSTGHCRTVWPENLLEEHLRRQKIVQVQKRKSICFNRVAPCMQGRHHYCSEFRKHARGYLESKLEAFQSLDRDFFLTASGSYADYDTVFAARLVHFLLEEAIRLGHPPRVLDMGCGRGSYVEVLRSWGIPVMGVDGNAIVLRTIQENGFLWDLTEPLDLRKAFGPQVSSRQACEFELDEGDRRQVRELQQQLSELSGSDLRLGILSIIPYLLQTDYWPSQHPEGHPEVPIEDSTAVEYLKALCCADQRCFGFSFTDDGGVLLLWREVESGEYGKEDMIQEGLPLWYQVTNSYFIGSWDDRRMLEIAGPGTYAEFQLQYSLMQVQFSTADWVISLGLGVEVPRMRENVVLENIVKHAEEGVIVSWGTKGRNLRSRNEVLQLFRSRGFVPDDRLKDTLQLFSGLAHAPEREDLHVFRRARAKTSYPDAPLELIDEWGGLECQEAGAQLRNGLQGHEKSQYGPLGQGRMWVSGHCAGLFRAGGGQATVCAGGGSKKWRECILSHEVQGQGGVPGPSVEMDSIEGSALYDMADHMVPKPGVWLGDARLNLVFFKIARALAAPGRVKTLQTAWRWFWTSKWEVLLAHPPEEHRVFHPWSQPVQPGVLGWQLGRVALALHQLSCRVRRLSQARPSGRSWHRALILQNSLEASFMKTGPRDINAAIQPIRKLQAEIVAVLDGVTVEEALSDMVFGDEILPRLWQLFAGDEVPEGSGGLGLIPREAGCADPVFEEVVRVAALWDKDSNVGWYLYRLAAIDPTM
ncbi:hypothetical protein AK812_SmicGene15013 [Symbiodinium microadriaticum]|uniref:Uncharacterized protein n=1 Tax=Symbiodinium microadriaticum TaxID=2951 RepID=A0A1Q9E425_SYMMI|nr:hypothetical protein AK812_SmicGene15013 [Symbiodinium microadriaticum]CAE7822693.1 unnamed protein product [Symbiodinium microadriaticum]CAE7946417.1 unnamed protein product [Symbiodinium sp. KB8]